MEILVIPPRKIHFNDAPALRPALLEISAYSGLQITSSSSLNRSPSLIPTLPSPTPPLDHGLHLGTCSQRPEYGDYSSKHYTSQVIKVNITDTGNEKGKSGLSHYKKKIKGAQMKEQPTK